MPPGSCWKTPSRRRGGSPSGRGCGRRSRRSPTAIGLFLAVSWLGVWLWLPPVARAIALFIFLVLTAAATVPLIFVRFPSRNDGLRRLDREAGMPIGRRPRSPTSSRPRSPIRGRLRCGAPMSNGRCSRRRRSRPAGRRRASTARPDGAARARRRSSSSRPSSPPAASGGAASPQRSTGRAWWFPRTSGSMPGCRRRPIPRVRR